MGVRDSRSLKKKSSFVWHWARFPDPDRKVWTEFFQIPPKKDAVCFGECGTDFLPTDQTHVMAKM